MSDASQPATETIMHKKAAGSGFFWGEDQLINGSAIAA